MLHAAAPDTKECKICIPTYIRITLVPIIQLTFNDLSFLRSLGTVFGTCLSSFCNTCCIKSSSDDVISYTRDILDSAASDKNNTMLLQIVADARDIRCDLDTVRQTYSGYLTKR